MKKAVYFGILSSLFFVISCGGPVVPIYKTLAKLIPSDSMGGDYFGGSVSLSQTGDMFAVGVPLDDVGSKTNQGSVLVYSWDGASWNAKRLYSDNTYPFIEFGNDVTVSSDGKRIVAGCYKSDYTKWAEQGAISIFSLSGSTWSETYIVNETGSEYDHFGKAVAVSGDGNTIIASTPDAYVGAKAAQGYVTILNWNGFSWVQSRTNASDGLAQDKFGAALDVSHDGKTFIVGVPNGDVGGLLDRGAAYIYRWDGVTSSWIQFKLIDSGNDISAKFGYSVAISADGLTAVIGDIGKDNGGNADQGSIWVYKWGGSDYNGDEIFLSDGQANEMFGSAVAISDDGNTIAAGGNMVTGFSIGQIIIYKWNGSAWVESKRCASDNFAADDFGFSVALSGDGSLVAIGESADDIAAPNAGAVWVVPLK